METEVISALISLAGVLISVMITFELGYWTHRFRYKQLFAQTVSSNRMEWINVWHKNISEFLACAEILHNHNKSSDMLMNIEKEMYEARAMITSRLNLNEEDHTTMLILLNSFSVHCSDQDFIKQRDAILALARKILKPEWERVKKEAKGEKNV